MPLTPVSNDDFDGRRTGYNGAIGVPSRSLPCTPIGGTTYAGYGLFLLTSYLSQPIGYLTFSFSRIRTWPYLALSHPARPANGVTGGYVKAGTWSSRRGQDSYVDKWERGGQGPERLRQVNDTRYEG
ncbi:hypothetical protein M408DRAFT_108297 [Serendipita vermifera MAFF 305830]|uniref:Uncharacterized protein n=1 Tax=Serendipita vermifera MAFF 305830 TaxID=933852 RepID=A0A0C2WUK8_SERVB|nr:hypothetical protein M408DRAFT_108297 [Serendipita vermifera MAFF 305830]